LPAVSKATRVPSGEMLGCAGDGAISPAATTLMAAFGAAVRARTMLGEPGLSDT